MFEEKCIIGGLSKKQGFTSCFSLQSVPCNILNKKNSTKKSKSIRITSIQIILFRTITCFRFLIAYDRKLVFPPKWPVSCGLGLLFDHSICCGHFNFCRLQITVIYFYQMLLLSLTSYPAATLQVEAPNHF